MKIPREMPDSACNVQNSILYVHSGIRYRLDKSTRNSWFQSNFWLAKAVVQWVLKLDDLGYSNFCCQIPTVCRPRVVNRTAARHTIQDSLRFAMSTDSIFHTVFIRVQDSFQMILRHYVIGGDFPVCGQRYVLERRARDITASKRERVRKRGVSQRKDALVRKVVQSEGKNPPVRRWVRSASSPRILKSLVPKSCQNGKKVVNSVDRWKIDEILGSGSAVPGF